MKASEVLEALDDPGRMQTPSPVDLNPSEQSFEPSTVALSSLMQRADHRLSITESKQPGIYSTNRRREHCHDGGGMRNGVFRDVLFWLPLFIIGVPMILFGYQKYTGAQLKRVLDIDIETFSECGGDVGIIASIEDPVVIRKILAHLDAKGTHADLLPQCRAPPVIGFSTGV